MPVTLANFGLAVSSSGDRIGLELAFPSAETHGSSQLIDALQFAELVDDAMGRARIKFARVGILESANIARKLNAGGLHSQANSEVRNVFLARVPDCIQHSINSAFAKAAGNQNAVVAFQL